MVAGLVLAGRRRARPLRGLGADPQGPARRRSPAGRHADRLQPGAGRGEHLLARRTSWVALITAVSMVLLMAVLLPASGPDRRPPRPGLRLPALVALRRHLRPSTSVLGDRANWRPRRARPRSAWPRSRRTTWVGFPSGTLADGVDVVHGPSLSMTFILLVLPGCDRTDRREHRPRQGGRRDDRRRPRPLHGPGDRRRRLRHRLSSAVRRLADHDLRREHRRHGATRVYSTAAYYVAGRRRDPAGPDARSSGPSSTPPRAASSAASPSCSTG